MNIVELETKTMSELQDMARELDITGYSRLKKHDLIMRLLQAKAEDQGLLFGGGILDIIPEGLGFLRSGDLLPSSDDIYVCCASRLSTARTRSRQNGGPGSTA
jgi:transcription termination factor Rho